MAGAMKMVGNRIPKVGEMIGDAPDRQCEVIEVYDKGLFVLTIHKTPEGKFQVVRWDKRVSEAELEDGTGLVQ